MENSALNRLERERALVCVIDVQEKLTRIMQTNHPWHDRLEFLCQGADVLGIPIFLTEQNPDKLGQTYEGLDLPTSATVFPKMSFSCLGSPEFLDALRSTEKEQIVLAGIEAHICVQATGLDLLRAGYEVFVARDACSSRLAHTGPVGLDRLRAAGAVLGTAESFLFECLDRCDEDGFRALLPLVRESV